MGQDVLVALGEHPYEAMRVSRLFRHHDSRMVRISAAHRQDEDKLVDLSRASRAEIARVLAADRSRARPDADHAWEPPDRPD
jgi:hypothetical protein